MAPTITWPDWGLAKRRRHFLCLLGDGGWPTTISPPSGTGTLNAGRTRAKQESPRVRAVGQRSTFECLLVECVAS